MTETINMKLIDNGLKLRKLGEVCTYSKGKKPAVLKETKTLDCSVPYINIKAFEKGIISEYTNGEKCNICNDDDLLMVWDGARCGLIGKAKKGAVGSTLMKILPKENIHKEYLYHFISSKFWTLNTKPKGVGIPHIEPTLLWNFELVVPPLAEQQAIVAKIEALLSELENGKQQLQTAQQQLKVYRQSLLKWAFEGKLTNMNVNEGELPKSWKWVKFGSIFNGTPQNGLYKPSTEYGSGVPILRIDGFYDGAIVNDYEYKRVRISNEELSKYKLSIDDIVVNRVNSMSHLGKCGLLKSLKEPTVFESNVMKIQLNKNSAVPRYISNYLSSLRGLKELTKNAKHAVNQASINQTDVSNVAIPLAPLSEQQQIVLELESKLTVCDKIEETISQSLQQAETLRQSILKKAFEGRLVTKELKTIIEKELA